MFDKQSIPDCMVVVKTNGNKVTIVEVNELVKLTQSINTSPSARAVEESFSPFFKQTPVSSSSGMFFNTPPQWYP